jgi:hypothetical protein
MNIIGSNLGPAYAAEYSNLTRGNFNYSPAKAYYLVYAFYNGFQSGYVHGAEEGRYVAAGQYASYGPQLEAYWKSKYAELLQMIRGWEYIDPDFKSTLEFVFWCGWDSGKKRGYGEKGATVPAPSEFDFRRDWSPAHAVPGASVDDLFGDLRNVPR